MYQASGRNRGCAKVAVTDSVLKSTDDMPCGCKELSIQLYLALIFGNSAARPCFLFSWPASQVRNAALHSGSASQAASRASAKVLANKDDEKVPAKRPAVKTKILRMI